MLSIANSLRSNRSNRPLACPWAVRRPAVIVGLLLGSALIVCITCGAAGQVWFVRRLGGYTGDCLGAVQQISEVAVYSAVLAVAYANRWPAG